MGERLRNAISPYLRSHADNPVDWFPWSAEAFAEAKRLDRPVLVSIGYSSCHWCHVMARESFSDRAIAAMLNEHFIAIKVDREEHPDVDASFMAAASAYSQNLGWPLTVFATPEGKTFYAGTYFPPHPAHGLPAFVQVLEAILDAWQNRRDQIEQQSEELRQVLQQPLQQPLGAGLDDVGRAPQISSELLEEFLPKLAGQEDPVEGGFGTGSKFPNAPSLKLLAESYYRHPEHDFSPHAGALLERTLIRMAESQLRDAVEGGFFRYTVQRDFTEPHYERMLYDNAQLLDLYSQVVNLSADDTDSELEPIVIDLGNFLIGTFQQPEGGFATAQDSESLINGEKSEGGYYHLDQQERSKQPAPELDRKILSGWNGLAISALLRAGARFAQESWIQAATRAAEYLIEHHIVRSDTEVKLLRASEQGRASTAVATLEDYGAFAQALIDLGLHLGRVDYLRLARDLVESCLVSEEDGVRFATPGDPLLMEQGTLLTSDQPDAALFSPLTSIALAAHSLSLIMHNPQLLAAVAWVVRQQTETRALHPLAASGAVLVALRHSTAPRQLVIITPSLIQETSRKKTSYGAENAEFVTLATRFPELSKTGVQAAQARYDLVAVVDERTAVEFAAAGFDLFESKTELHGSGTVYSFESFSCELPQSVDAFVGGV